MIKRLILTLFLLPLAAFAQSGSTGGTVRSTGTPAANDCVKYVSKNVITTAGAACGGGSSAFSGLTSGTNTTAAMIVGTGASLTSVPQFNIGAVGTAGVLGLVGSTSGTATFTAPAVAGTTTNPIVSSNAIQLPNGAVSTPSLTFAASANTGIFTSGAGSLDFVISGTEVFQLNANGVFPNKPICDYALGTGCLTFTTNLISVSGSGNAILHSTNNNKIVTTDFTDANSAALQAITGLSYPLGSTAQVFSFHCGLMYSQATVSAGDQFGVGVITTAPTNVSATGTAYTSTTASLNGSLTGLATTTPTAVMTFTPTVTSVQAAYLDGTIETAGGGAATFNVYVLNGTSADVIVVKRGSYCTLH